MRKRLGLGPAAPVTAFGDELEEGAEACARKASRRRAPAAPRAGGAAPQRHLVAQRLVHFFLGLEVIVEGARGQRRGADDVAHRGGGKAQLRRRRWRAAARMVSRFCALVSSRRPAADWAWAPSRELAPFVTYRQFAEPTASVNFAKPSRSDRPASSCLMRATRPGPWNASAV